MTAASASLRVIDTGLAGARRNVAAQRGADRGARARGGPRHAAASPLRDMRADRPQPGGGHGARPRACRRRGAEIARRVTGGGAVAMAPGILAWDLVTARRRWASLDAASATLGGRWPRRSRTLGFAAAFRAPGEVAVAGRKVAGLGGAFEGPSLLLQGSLSSRRTSPRWPRFSACRRCRWRPWPSSGRCRRRGDRRGARRRLRGRLGVEAVGMTRRLLIVLVNTDPRNPEELGAPFYHAAVAAAMDYEVDVVCAATAGKLMVKGVAEKLNVKPGHPMTVLDWIREAHGAGARFWACPANLDLFEVREEDLIPECGGLMGAATMIQGIMDDDCRVLTY